MKSGKKFFYWLGWMHSANQQFMSITARSAPTDWAWESYKQGYFEYKYQLDAETKKKNIQ